MQTRAGSDIPNNGSPVFLYGIFNHFEELVNNKYHCNAAQVLRCRHDCADDARRCEAKKIKIGCLYQERKMSRPTGRWGGIENGFP
jgi:hypothetical protein